MDDSRYSRNVALFGNEGQEKIAATSVAVIGMGGLGCHVVQQLAYLGVPTYGLVDDDIITESSLNRVVGAVPEDARAEMPKVAVAERLIRSVLPEASIDPFKGLLTASHDDRAADIVQSADVIFGCLDKESPRLFLTDLCSSLKKPYFDLATDTGGEDEDWYGGRVVFCDGSRCLSCLGLLDQRAIRMEQMTEEEHAIEVRTYGLKHVGGTGPSVVSVNGVVASMAVTEFMVHITKLRMPAAQLIYRGDLPLMTLSKDRGEGCPYCARW